MEAPAAHQASREINAWIVEHAGIKKLKILVMVNIKKNSRVEYLDQVISSPAATVSCGRAPGPGLKKLKHITKFERSGGQLARAHSLHYVIVTERGLEGVPFFDKDEATSWAASNIKEYFEIHKDWFVE